MLSMRFFDRSFLGLRLLRGGTVRASVAPLRTRTTRSPGGTHDAAYYRRSHFRARRRARPLAFTDDDPERAGAAAGMKGAERGRGKALALARPIAKAALPKPPRRSKFSFLRSPTEHLARDYFLHAEVPNSAPKPLLPMWASSLTSPALGRQRLVVDNWISQDGMGRLSAGAVDDFLAWILREEADGGVLPKDHILRTQLRENVELHLRTAYRRGVYARRDFLPNEVILSIPLTTARSTEEDEEGKAPSCARAETTGAAGERSNADEAGQLEKPWRGGSLALNLETLRAHSVAARRRGVLPYNVVHDVLSIRRSPSFDPIPHRLFIEQVHLALYLACEKAEGAGSPLYDYFRLLDDSESVHFDDDRIRELHLGVLDPLTHLEYTDHCNRFTHSLRELHRAWWKDYQESGLAEGRGAADRALEAEPALPGFSSPVAVLAKDSTVNVPPRFPLEAWANGEGKGKGEGERAGKEAPSLSKSPPSSSSSQVSRLPPPSLADILWAFRVVLSRQRALPLRGGPPAGEAPAEGRGEADGAPPLGRFARAVMAGKWGFYRHFLRALDDEPARAPADDPTAAPTVVPLLDLLQHAPGGHANAAFSLEVLPCDRGEPGAAPAGSGAREKAAIPHVVVRARQGIEALDELTVLFPRCYSVAYTLFRFGFLPLRSREEDAAAGLALNGVRGEKGEENERGREHT